MVVCGTLVAAHPHPHAEICHGFVYNWLIARGRLNPQPGIDPNGGPFNGVAMRPILWGQQKQPVRVAGANRVKTGDIIGFFDAQGALIHTMIAEAPTTWVGSNNQGCFGTGTGRTVIPNIYARRSPPVGWVDTNSNKLKSMGGDVYAYFRTP